MTTEANFDILYANMSRTQPYTLDEVRTELMMVSDSDKSSAEDSDSSVNTSDDSFNAFAQPGTVTLYAVLSHSGSRIHGRGGGGHV